MNQVNLQEQKLDIIAQIALIEDDNVIKQIKGILSKSIDIPDWQKKELDKRWAAYLENPESAIDVDQAFEEIEKELS